MKIIFIIFMAMIMILMIAVIVKKNDRNLHNNVDFDVVIR